MTVPNSPDHRLRMLIWGWAMQGYGWEDIKVLLWRECRETMPQWEIWGIVVQAERVKR